MLGRSRDKLDINEMWNKYPITSVLKQFSLAVFECDVPL